jgi:hypothetical protein
MRAFEVYLNGKKLCTSGVNDDGVLTAIVSSATRPSSEDLSLHVGGLEGSGGEHLLWARKKLGSGDKVQIKIIDSKSVDKPGRGARRASPAERLKQEKRYVRQMAKRFGWKIQVRPKRSSS